MSLIFENTSVKISWLLEACSSTIFLMSSSLALVVPRPDDLIP